MTKQTRIPTPPPLGKRASQGTLIERVVRNYDLVRLAPAPIPEELVPPAAKRRRYRRAAEVSDGADLAEVAELPKEEQPTAAQAALAQSDPAMAQSDVPEVVTPEVIVAGQTGAELVAAPQPVQFSGPRHRVARQHLRDLGAFLSGGVDSSSVVALMAEASASPVNTCSIGFDDASLDETTYARLVAERFGCNHRTRTVGAADFEHVDTLVDMFDEPFADASALPTWRVSQLARESVTVALSGDGADEALAGYRRHRFHHAEERVRGLLPAALRQPLFGAFGAVYPKADWAPQQLRAKATFQALALDGAHGYARAVGFVPAEQRQQLFSESFLRERGDYRAEQRFVALMRGAPARSGLDRAQYADLKFWLPGDILTKVDRTSMAVSLETRDPLLDHRLIEFAAALPERLRLRGGQGKWLMKRAMRRYLPDDVLFRPKQGFVTPISQWLRGPLAGPARAITRSAAIPRTGWFDGAVLSNLAEEHIAGFKDHGRLLWQLLMLDRSLSRLGIVA